MKTIHHTLVRSVLALGALCGALAAGALPARAETIIDAWSTVKAPPPPAVQAVKVDPKTTAVLALDFVKQTCNEQARPRCVASLPAVAKLIAAARAAGAPVIYSIIGASTPADVLAPVARNANEPYVQAQADKFIKTDLDKLLADRHIKTVIVTGTTAEGAVLYTASHAAFLGYDVIVPVDGMSAATLYAEQYVAWNMAHAPGVSAKTKLTTIGQIGF